MSSMIYDELSLERIIREHFGVIVEIRQKIVVNVPVGSEATATLFLSGKKQMFLFIGGNENLIFRDVKKIVGRMGMKAELYVPPRGRIHYFDEVGRSKFHEVFPGRKFASGDDISFYRTLAPYSPALVLISEIKDGYVYQQDSAARSGWRQAAKFSYRRIKTS